VKLFVYGTLRKGYGNHRFLNDERVRFLGRGETAEKYAMYCVGIPFVTKEKQVSKIKGEVYEVPEDVLSRIDSLEGHPYAYRRELTEVVLEDGQKLTAWIYFYPYERLEGRGLTLIESGDYADCRSPVL